MAGTEVPEIPADEGGAEPWTVLGDCELFEEIGRGGMGTVYRARQRRLRRTVAVKVLRGGELATEEAKARFRAEAENAARLQHPGIVAIYDVGEAQGVCWFSMDLVAGESLDRTVREQPMPARDAAGCVEKIAGAIQHAHDHGVLHRDLKPPNILLGSDGEPRVTDFGIARRFGAASESGTAPLTRTGQMLGSPGYAAPEQALRGQADVRTDVYGLGAILYHLLTGRPPFQGPTLDAILVQLRENEPLSPRRLNPSVPTDLETICLKCLSPEPVRRYASAKELAADLRRFLENRPITARPPALFGRALRWMRRHPGNAALLGSLVAGTAAAFFVVDQSRRQEAAARHEEKSAKSLAEARLGDLGRANARISEVLDTTDLERAEDWFARGQRDFGLASLTRILRRTPDHPVAGPRLASACYHGGTAVAVLMPFVEMAQVSLLQLVNEGRGLLVATDRGASIRDPATGKKVREFAFDHPPFRDFALSPNGELLAGWWDEPGGWLVFWDTATGSRRELRHPEKIAAAAVSSDAGLLLAVGGASAAQWFDTKTGALLPAAESVPGPATACAFSRDGKLAATATGAGILLWDLPARTVRGKLVSRTRAWSRLQFSGDGLKLAGGGTQGEVDLFDLLGRNEPLWTARHAAAVTSLEFSPSNHRLLTASDDHTARIWNVGDGSPRGAVMQHRGKVYRARFDSDATVYIATVSGDNTTRLWHAHSGSPLCQPVQHAEQAKDAVISLDKKMLYCSGADGIVQRWRLNGAYLFPVWLRHESAVLSACWSPAGTVAATTGLDRRTALWNARGEMLGSASQLAESSFMLFTPDGSGIFTAGGPGVSVLKSAGPDLPNVRTFSAPDGGPHLMGCLNSQGTRYAAGDADGRFFVWDTASGELALPPIAPRRQRLRTVAVQFSPDDRQLLTVAASTVNEKDDAFVRDANTGAVLFELAGHDDDIQTARYSPDGRLIATAGNDNAARVWDARSGKTVLPPLRHNRAVADVAFNPDGKRLATASMDHSARIWDTSTGMPLSPPLLHDDAVVAVCFSPQGDRLATGSADQSARLWHPPSGLMLCEPFWHPYAVQKVSFAPDGRRLLTVTSGPAWIWETPVFPPSPPAWLIDLAEILSNPGLENDQAKMLALVARYEKTLEAIRQEPSGSPWRRLALRLVPPPE